MQKIKKFFNKNKSKVITSTAIAATTLTSFASASTGEGLSLNFDTTTMFSWAQTILDAMMPVVYISMGVGLGFLIVRALKSAFS